MANNYRRARDFEASGDLDKAAKHYALDGFEILVKEKFENQSQVLLGAATFLRAISCDVRVENLRRATFLFEFARILFESVRSETDDEILQGLTYEWVGDGYLMLHDERALDCYTKALDKLADVVPGHGWGGEEEFDNALWAYNDFIEAFGYSLPKSANVYFDKRLEAKLSISDMLLN